MKIKAQFFAIGLACALAPNLLSAAADDFFRGKTIRIVVGVSAGGGFDTYARAIARHMGKHIPGNPQLLVENMPGAGHRIAANHLYKVARPDGLTIGNVFGGLLVGQVLDYPGIEFDAIKFKYLGVPVQDGPVCALTKASGITSYERWRASKAPVKLGATGTDDLMLYGIPKIINAVLDLPVQVIGGYKGTAEIRLAAESGELAGACWGWEAIKVTWRKALDSSDVNVVLQAVPQSHPDLTNVPLAINLAKTDEGRQLIELGVHSVSAITRPYLLPPATPNDRVQTLRRAFAATMKDDDFLAEMHKSKLDINPISGDDLEGIINKLFQMKPETLAKLKEVLK
jgi:tripartite-type tricarboxylate transporter receptor subunit TctC